jgi:predicted DCC family thiol-disulfide oxidoreductase YuxK
MTVTRVHPPVLIYDGNCGFCTKAAGGARRIARPNVTIAASSAINLSDLGLTADECNEALKFVDACGTIYSGAAAVSSLLESSVGAWPCIGRTMGLPGIRRLADVSYRLVARNRHRLPGATASCAA